MNLTCQTRLLFTTSRMRWSSCLDSVRPRIRSCVILPFDRITVLLRSPEDYCAHLKEAFA